MQKVSDAYRQEMERPVLGAAKLAVTLSVVDEDAAPGAEDKSCLLYTSDAADD